MNLDLFRIRIKNESPMMKHYLYIIFSIHLIFSQQAWTREQNTAYVQIGSSLFNYSSIFDQDGKEEQIPYKVSQMIISLYAEYGINDALMFSMNIPYHAVKTGDLNPKYDGFISSDNDKINDFGNMEFALTNNAYSNNGIVIAAKFAVRLNTSERNKFTGLQTGQYTERYTPSLLFGIGRSDYFASAELAYGLQSNDYADRFIFNSQIGKEFLESRALIAILSFNIDLPVGEIKNIDRVNLRPMNQIPGYAVKTGLYLNDYAYTAWNAKLGYRISDEFLLWASMGGGAGKNLGRAPVFNFAIAYELK